MMKPSIFQTLLALFYLVFETYQKCAFQVNENNYPVKVDKEPFLIQGMTLCKQYNGLMGCCNSGNDAQQAHSYIQIDGIFGSQGGECDVCGINLKRFYCEYACSPKQSQFLDIKDGYFPVPNPQKPDEIVNVMVLKVKVHADTACDLYSSCARNSFVNSVSAMSTPAGFLTFQGHNAVNDASQFMEIQFSYNKSDSLYLGNDNVDEGTKQLTECNATLNKQLHGFPVYKNCTCNNCAQSCKQNQGFVYTEPKVFEDFNYVKVGSVWAISIMIGLTVTSWRNKNKVRRSDKKNM